MFVGQIFDWYRASKGSIYMWEEVEYVPSNDITKLACEASKYKDIEGSQSWEINDSEDFSVEDKVIKKNTPSASDGKMTVAERQGGHFLPWEFVLEREMESLNW